LKAHSNKRFFGTWVALFVAGVLLLKYGAGAWPAFGMLIVAPTIIAVLLMAWGWIIVRLIRAFGGDPSDGAVGVWIFVSFAFVVLPLLIAILRHRG
jgi:hypothetical protein